MENFVVAAYDWTVLQRANDDGSDIIVGWALNEKSETVCVRVTGFPSTIHIELPFNVGTRAIKWSNDAFLAVYTTICRLLKDSTPSGMSYAMRFKTYYASTIMYPILTISFPSLRMMHECVSLLSRPLRVNGIGDIMVRVWEQDIELETKFFTDRKLQPCQWFEGKGTRMSHQFSTCQHEYSVRYTDIVPRDDIEDLANPKVLSMDIEAYSHRHRAMPVKTNPECVAYMVSCVARRLRDTVTERYGIIMGDCDHIPPEKLENVSIIHVVDEVGLIQAYADVIAKVDPDIILGYNIYGFDNDYLDMRLKRLLVEWPTMGRLKGEKGKIISKSWKSGAYGYNNINYNQASGRITIDMLSFIRRKHKLSKYDLNTVSLKFLKRGKLDVKAQEMFRIFARLRDATSTILPYWRLHQSDPERFASSEIQAIYEKIHEEYLQARTEITEVMLYCLRDAELPLDLFEKLSTWAVIVTESNVNRVTPIRCNTSGQQVRCMAQYYRVAHEDGMVMDKRNSPTFPFDGGAVAEPIIGVHDNIIILDFASMYPSIIIRYNICHSTFVPENSNIPDEYCHIIEFDQEEEEKDEDEEEEEPSRKKTKKQSKVETKTHHYRFRFIKQEYREGIIPRIVKQLIQDRKNVRMKIETAQKTLKECENADKIYSLLHEYRLLLADEFPTLEQQQRPEILTYRDRIIELQNDLIAKKTPASEYSRFLETMLNYLETNDRLTAYFFNLLYPVLLAEIDTRRQTMEKIKIDLDVYDKLQLAIKVSANSFFGFLGVRNGAMMSLMEGAMSITALGRQLIKLAADYVVKTYNGRVVYGDTDSIMVDIGITDPAQCHYWGHRLAAEINGLKVGDRDPEGKIVTQDIPGLFPPPLKMEFEKAARIVNFKKKKYAYLYINKNGSFKTIDKFDAKGNLIGSTYEMATKGIVVQRRDNCAFLRETYLDLLEDVLLRRPFSHAFEKIANAVLKIANNQVEVEKLTIVRGLGANYAKDNYFMKVFADRLTKDGKIVNPGDRLEYVIIKDEKLEKVSHRMRLLEEYYEMGDNASIDSEYYITKSLMNPLDQLIGVGFMDKLRDYQDLFFVSPKSGKKIYLNEPVKLLSKFLRMSGNVAMLIEAIKNREHEVEERGPVPPFFVVQRNIIPQIIRATGSLTQLPNPFAHIHNYDAQPLRGSGSGEFTPPSPFRSIIQKTRPNSLVRAR